MSTQWSDRGVAVEESGGAAAPFRLNQAAADLYEDLRLGPVLDSLLVHTARITGIDSAAVSMIDAADGKYTKAAEHGVACQIGRSFSLDEGATGRAFAARRPVFVPDYTAMRGSHVSPSALGTHRCAVAVPVWWRDQVVAVNVAFRPIQAAFTTAMIDEIESLTQTASAAIMRSGGGLASATLHGRGDARSAAPVSSPLTTREREVLVLVRDGRTDREIAARLFLSPKTVEKHVGAAMRKIVASNRTAAVAGAIDRGWIASA